MADEKKSKKLTLESRARLHIPDDGEMELAQLRAFMTKIRSFKGDSNVGLQVEGGKVFFVVENKKESI